MSGKRPPDGQACDLAPAMKDPGEFNKLDFKKAFFIMNKTVLYIFFLFSSGSLSSTEKLMFETSSLFDYELMQASFKRAVLIRFVFKMKISIDQLLI